MLQFKTTLMQQEIINRLSREYTSARGKNPSYSLRAFSKKIGIQPSALSEILNGKRVVSSKMGKRILDGLGTNPIESKKIITGFQDNNTETANLNLEHFKVISDWYYFAILSLAEIEDFSIEPEWIAKRLNIQRREAKKAVETLLNLGMLEKDELKGNYKATGIQYKTPSDIANISLKTHTFQTLDLARESLISDPIESRDFSTVTMAIDPRNIDEAKRMIQVFRRRLTKRLESGNKKEVYKLAIQLFPLSRNGNEGKENV